MPNRIIKESICTSEQIALLKDFEFRLWVGLITQADDAGRGDARPQIIKGRVFPLRESVTIKQIDDALYALASHGLVVLYKVGGKPFYVFPSWAEHQRIRDCKPKYPAPEESDTLPQVAADCGELPQSAAIIQSNPNMNPNPNTDNTRKRAFVPPTLDEIKAYCAERNSNVDPMAFYNFFTTPNERGETWVDSRGNKVKNWKQKLLTWEGHSAKSVGKKSDFMDYKQRKYTKAELNGMGNNLLEAEQ